jgi:2-haloacid dehalogenase
VAVHSWDVHGARQAGLLTGWASRLEGQFPAIFDRPAVIGADLVEVVEGLLALPDID